MTYKFLELDCLSVGCKAFLSTNDFANTAVVFVHGFKGDPIKTWKDFPGIATLERHLPQWATCDLYFFDYSDVKRSIDDSSDDLKNFLNGIFPHPIQVIENLITKTRNHSQQVPIVYDRLILVGHSEGGVVIRACIAELGKGLYRDSASAILEARLVLFAPALFGFMPTSWTGLVCQFFPVRQLLEIATTLSVAAAELKDVRTLDQVREINEKLWKDFPQFQALAAHVLFGENESVVRKQRYLQDYKYQAVSGKDHVTVCKPTAAYQQPLSFVIGEN